MISFTHSFQFFYVNVFSQSKVLNDLPTNLTIKFTLNELYSLSESQNWNRTERKESHNRDKALFSINSFNRCAKKWNPSANYLNK